MKKGGGMEAEVKMRITLWQGSVSSFILHSLFFFVAAS